ncbi:hypothetical protein Ahy_A06g027890 [Arachis hypogaea]|uniref:Uncharacterized protein n=1 Tax=Arachis hypogaea TaxID=3818 RepID=A0A445CQ57_ARAHY|nr:hypothetical protein Ahy_A06g027890 [Arachis hypogaea]
MARDQTRYRTPSLPPFANLENMEEDENTSVTRREFAWDHEAELQDLEGKREVVESKMEEYHRRPSLAYDKQLRPRVFLEGDLVLKSVDAAMRKMSVPKWAPK